MSDPGRETTLDTVFPDSLFCHQYRDGYRFNQDSVILAHFIEPGPEERILDLGAGCGIIGLILAHRWPEVTVTGLEVQADLAALARRNVHHNGFADRVEIVEGDLNNETLLDESSFDRIVCNPPYTDPKKSRSSENLEKARARQGIQAGPENLCRAASRLLVDGGRFDLVYPVERTPLLIPALNQFALFPAKLRPVHGYPQAPAMLFMIEAIKNGGGELETLPPFFIANEKGGGYSPEMRQWYLPQKRELQTFE